MKKIINFLLNFIMSILVFILICMNFTFSTVFNKTYIKTKLTENRFYERAYADVKERFENYTMQSGLELDILEGLVTKEKVKKDINQKIDAIYDNQKITIETDSIRNELDARINAVLEKNNKTPNTTEKESIQKYEDAIVESYQAEILYGKSFSIPQKDFQCVRTICIIGIVVISILLLFINKSISKYMAFLGITGVFSGTLCVVVKRLLEKRIIHILIMDAKFSHFLVNTLTDMLLRFYHMGISIMAVGFLLIIIGSLENFKKTIENKKN